MIAIITSPTINSVLASSSTNKSTSSYPKSNISLSIPSTPQRDNNNLTSTFAITDQIKALIDDRLDENKTNSAIVIGLIDPNRTQFYSHGKMSNSSHATVDENTVFSIGSNTKVFITTLLADLVNKGRVYIGLGWFVTTNFGHEIIRHNGATIGGYNAYMAFNPVTERGIVILCSTDIADINLTRISFDQTDNLSSLIWGLLNQ